MLWYANLYDNVRFGSAKYMVCYVYVMLSFGDANVMFGYVQFMISLVYVMLG